MAGPTSRERRQNEGKDRSTLPECSPFQISESTGSWECAKHLEKLAKRWSGRGDSNSRSLDPQSSAITRLRYVPTLSILRRTLAARLGRAHRSAACRSRLARRGLAARCGHRPHPRRGGDCRRGETELVAAVRAGQQFENRLQPALDGGQPLAR